MHCLQAMRPKMGVVVYRPWSRSQWNIITAY